MARQECPYYMEFEKMKEKIKEIALQAGGSHYPEVGGDLLQKFADLLLLEVIEVVENTPKHCAFTTFQENIVECTIQKSIETLKTHFDLT
jgi:hypothetical protein